MPLGQFCFRGTRRRYMVNSEQRTNQADLTIITISRDDAAGLALTLKSISLQIVQPFEVVVVRCGTSLDLDLDEFGITSLIERSDPRNGISGAFNAGLDASSAAWVMFLNGGDELHDESTLKTLHEAIQSSSNPTVQIIGGFACSLRGGRVPVSRPRTLHDNLYLSHQASIFRQSLFNSVGLFDTSYMIRMDLDWLARFGERFGSKGVLFIDSNLVRYEPEGVSSRRWILFYLEELRVLIVHPVYVRRIFRVLFWDIPSRLASPTTWKRRFFRLIGRRAVSCDQRIEPR